MEVPLWVAGSIRRITSKQEGLEGSFWGKLGVAGAKCESKLQKRDVTRVARDRGYNLWLLIVEKVWAAAVGGSERWRSAKSVKGAYLCLEK